MNKKLLKKAFEAGMDYEYGKRTYTEFLEYPSFTEWYNRLIKESDSSPCVSVSDFEFRNLTVSKADNDGEVEILIESQNVYESDKYVFLPKEKVKKLIEFLEDQYQAIV